MATVLYLPRVGRGPVPPPEAGWARRFSRLGAACADRRDRAKPCRYCVCAIARCCWARSGTGPSTTRCCGRPSTPFGASPEISIVLMGYLIGQLGGLLPIPGGIGGIDGGLFGALILYGAPVASDGRRGARLSADPVLASIAGRGGRVRVAPARSQRPRPPGAVLRPERNLERQDGPFVGTSARV